MTQIAFRGNTTGPVEIRSTGSGKTVGNVTVAVNRGKEEDKKTDFYRVTLWDGLADNAAQLDKGTSVIVLGRIESRDYETTDGSKRTAWEVTADSYGPDLRFASAQVTRSGGGSRQQTSWNAATTAPTAASDPWNTPADDPGLPF